MNSQELQALVAALPHANTLDLYRLEYAIRALRNEPRRVLEIRRYLHVGMVVRFFDATSGLMRNGKIAAFRQHDVAIDETDRPSRWSGVPYAALEVLPTSKDDGVEIIDPVPSSPRMATRTRTDFQVGDSVSFTDRNGRTMFGKIVRLNQKTASVDTDGGSWRVPYPLLQPVVDL